MLLFHLLRLLDVQRRKGEKSWLHWYAYDVYYLVSCSCEQK